MNRPTPSREEEIFSALVALPVPERGAYLEKACGEDAALRQRLEGLLQSFDEAEGFMPGPAVTDIGFAVAEQAPPLPTENIGQSIGRYKLLQKIGEGGCGVVYMAEQQEPVRRRVALKVIKLGMDTKEVIARFEAERQALALMDHANIARVFDAGATDTGRPFFVMELVRGIPITKYCDEQNLPTSARLELFTQVCHAVQHAHQKAVIHRDIKPSNILVTLHDGKPVPKVIDFGIAKATQGRLTDATLFTAFEQFIGTPAYMSPEQAEMSGLDIDTRSDIYSLGVLLYELLTGRPPFDPKTLVAAGLLEIRRIIREVEPPRPSTRLSTLTDLDRATIARQRGILPAQLSMLLRGDLDWIVMRCLEKDRTRRYETANGLAFDVLRHLHDEPVVARPPNATYRLRKFIRRNRLAFGAGAAVALALIAGVAVSTWQAVRATQAEHLARTERTAAIAERARAESARNEAETARAGEADLRVKAEADEKKAQLEAARSAQFAEFMRGMLQGVAPHVARGRDTKLLGDILNDTGVRIGKDLADQPEIELDLQKTLAGVYLDISDARSAVAAYRRALVLHRQLAGPDHHQDVAATLARLGQALINLGDLPEAEARLREALALQHAIPDTDSSDTRRSLSSALERQGKWAESEALRRESLALVQKRWAHDELRVAMELSTFGLFLGFIRKSVEAEQHLRAALAIRRKVAGDNSAVVARSLADLAVFLRERKDRLEEAESVSRELVALSGRLRLKDEWERSARMHLGLTLMARGKHAEAVEAYREVVAASRNFFGNDHSHLSAMLNSLGSALSLSGQHDEALAALRESVAIVRRAGLRSELWNALNSLGHALKHGNKPGEAEDCFREALALCVKVHGEEHSSTANILWGLHGALKSQGKDADAAEVDRRRLQLLEKLRRTLGPMMGPPPGPPTPASR